MNSVPAGSLPQPSASGRRHWGVVVAAIAGAALAIRLALPVPPGLRPDNWSLLVLFIATLASLIALPSRIGPVMIIALTAGSLMRLFTIEQALDGYSNNVLWLILSAFFIARAFIRTGLGRRIALHIIRRFSRNSLQLGYSLALTDLVLAPVTASNTARTGAIIFPIAGSLAREFESEPGESARRIGSFLLFTAFQSNLVTSAMFMTAMAANPLAAELARQITGIPVTWTTWMIAGCVPGGIALFVIPYLIYRAYPPSVRETPHAREYALSELDKMGKTSGAEQLLVVILTLLALAWTSSRFHGIDTVTAALVAVCLLLGTGILAWDDLVEERRAWSTFLWWGAMLSLASLLNKSGVVAWFTNQLGRGLAGHHAFFSLVLILAVYVYAHYGFAGQTAHVVALYAPFLAVAVAAGAPPLLSALLLGFFSNLNASLTHYGDGAAPIYYGSGYIDQRAWWRVGFLISLAHLLIWIGVGIPWARLTGIW